MVDGFQFLNLLGEVNFKGRDNLVQLLKQSELSRGKGRGAEGLGADSYWANLVFSRKSESPEGDTLVHVFQHGKIWQQGLYL